MQGLNSLNRPNLSATQQHAGRRLRNLPSLNNAAAPVVNLGSRRQQRLVARCTAEKVTTEVKVKQTQASKVKAAKLRAAQLKANPIPAIPAESAPAQATTAEAAPAQAAPPPDVHTNANDPPTIASSIETLEGGGDEKTKAGSSGIATGIRLENISVTFKNQQVLKDCSWEVKKGERVGLVGVNGAGKTTQLQVVMGKVFPDAGEIVKAKKNMKIAYLAQEFDVDPSRTVREEFYSVYTAQMKIVNRLEQITVDLENVGEDMVKMQSLLDEMDKLNSKAIDLDVTLLDKKIDKMMPELGFKAEDNERLVLSYSGGWQMRMCLGKMLLQEPDLLLLDEPTNHLDLDAIEWLEKYLKEQEVPMVIVSHDREFLDQLCTKIVETERGVATTYPGNYSKYTAAKDEKTALQWSAWEKQQKELAKQQEIVARLTGGAQSGRASTAEKTIERIKADGLIEKPFVPKQRSFTFPQVEKMGQRAVTIEGLTHGYGGRTLFKNVNLEIDKGDRVAIIGPNGAGKSTLLRLIMGREKPLAGSASLGDYNIVPNYFEQNQAEALDLKLTVLETLIQASPEEKLNDLKALLGRMLFPGSAMDKKVKVLSGGEKARLALAKFMCTQGTILVLDEPTNHLDIPSKEMLEEAIRAFQGTVIAVSHDRYFLRQIATRILLTENQSLIDFEGDYDYYLEQNEEEAVKMEVKEDRAKEVAKDLIKSTSKMTKAQKERSKKDKAKAFNTAAADKKKKA